VESFNVSPQGSVATGGGIDAYLLNPVGIVTYYNGFIARTATVNIVQTLFELFGAQCTVDWSHQFGQFMQ
jgi:hypothetical protein